MKCQILTFVNALCALVGVAWVCISCFLAWAVFVVTSNWNTVAVTSTHITKLSVVIVAVLATTLLVAGATVAYESTSWLIHQDHTKGNSNESL